MSETLGDNATARLRSIVDRYENLEDEIAERRSDQKDIIAEAKSAGFDPDVIRDRISERKKMRKNPEKMKKILDMRDTYDRALGDFANTPLGNSMRPEAHA